MTESWSCWAIVWRRRPELAESFYRRPTGEIPLYRDEEHDRGKETAHVLNVVYPGCGARVVRVRVCVEEVLWEGLNREGV